MDSEQWQNYFESSGEEIWTIIEQAIIEARTNYHLQLRVRRDWFTKLMYAPLLPHTTLSDEVLSKGSDSGRTNAMSKVSKANVVEENDEKGVYSSEDEYEDEAANEIVQIDSSEDEDEGEAGNEIVQIDSSGDEDEDEAANEMVQIDSSEDEDEDEAANEIVQIDSSEDEDEDEAANGFVQMDGSNAEYEDEAANELLQVDSSNNEYNADEGNNSFEIGVKREDKESAEEVVHDVTLDDDEILELLLDEIDSIKNSKEETYGHESLETLVVEWRKSVLALRAASGQDESVASAQDKGGLLAPQHVKMADVSSFTDDELSPVSWPISPTSAYLSDSDYLSDCRSLPRRWVKHCQGGRYSSGPHHESKGVTTCYEVDKHRPVHASIVDQKNIRSATASGRPLYTGLVTDSEKLEGSKRKLHTKYMSAKKYRQTLCQERSNARHSSSS